MQIDKKINAGKLFSSSLAFILNIQLPCGSKFPPEAPSRFAVPQRMPTFPAAALHFAAPSAIIIPLSNFSGGSFMLFWIGLGVLLIGGIIARVAAKRGDGDEGLKKLGIALIFIATAILLFVLTINILVWTGRFGVTS
jgi:hypothetical protein